MRIGITKMRGAEHIKQKLGRRAASDLEAAIEVDMRVETQKMATDAYRGSPVETGALRTSILSSPTRAGKLTYYWGSKLPYALRQEYEHQPKMGWMRGAWERGEKSMEKTVKKTILSRLKGG